MKGPHAAPSSFAPPSLSEPPRLAIYRRMMARAQSIILTDRARLPWRFFGRLTAVQAGL